jgi:CheY-like chemotaxis protein
MRLLLVEDEDPKREHILAFLSRRLPTAEITIAKSARSAVASLREHVPDLLLLDMSLPTFDVSANESGGRPQGFGGTEVLRYMDRFKISVPTIVITAYEAFFSTEKKGIDLARLSQELQQTHSRNYRGLIYYNSIIGGWDEELSTMIEKIFPEVII